MSQYIVRPEQRSSHNIFPGVDVHTASGQQIMLSYVEFEPGGVVEPHAHPHEQMGILLEGELLFVIGDERHQLTPGDMWRIPGGVVHSAVAGNAPVRALDVFHPIREDYR